MHCVNTEQKVGLQELITSTEELPQMCYCFTLAAPRKMCGQNLVPWSFTEVGCYRTRIAASHSAKTQQK